MGKAKELNEKLNKISEGNVPQETYIKLEKELNAWRFEKVYRNLDSVQISSSSYDFDEIQKFLAIAKSNNVKVKLSQVSSRILVLFK